MQYGTTATISCAAMRVAHDIGLRRVPVKKRFSPVGNDPAKVGFVRNYESVQVEEARR